MADTALTIITDALLDIGVLADEETPSASQAAGGLRKLNNMIDAWNIESMMVYGAYIHVIPLIANNGVYTIGPGGDLNIPRPSLIQSAYIRDTSVPVAIRQDIPLRIANDQEWQQVPFKGQQSQYPYNTVWFNYSSPLIEAYVNPIPNTSQFSLVIWVPGDIANFTLNQDIILSPGYKRALTANLCIELAGSYQVEVPASVVQIAKDSKVWIQTANLQINEMGLPSALTDNAFWDYRSGGYV